MLNHFLLHTLKIVGMMREKTSLLRLNNAINFTFGYHYWNYALLAITIVILNYYLYYA